MKKALTGRQNVLVFGTPATVKRRLYEFNDVGYFRLTQKEMDQISESILRFNRLKYAKQQKITRRRLASQ